MVKLSNSQLMAYLLVFTIAGVVLFYFLTRPTSQEEEGFTNMGSSELMGEGNKGDVKPSEGVGENEVFHEVQGNKKQQGEWKR